MPINTNVSSVSHWGPVKTRDAASRWSSTAKLSAIYSANAVREDPQMMKADNLKFNPGEMLKGASLGPHDTDPSHQRVMQDRLWTPIMYTAGGLIAFLILVSFLRKK